MPAPALLALAGKLGLSTLAPWVASLAASGALKALNSNATKNAIHVAGKAINNSVGRTMKNLASLGAGTAASAATKSGMRIGAGNVGNAINGIISANGFPYLGMDNGRRFMNAAQYIFLSRYLPTAYRSGRLGGSMLEQLLMPLAGGGGGGGLIPPTGRVTFPFPDGPDGPDGPFPPGPYDGPNPLGPYRSGVPDKFRRLGWGGGRTAGGMAVEDALRQFFDDPFTDVEWEIVSPEEGTGTDIGADPLDEERRYRAFLRKEKAKDAKHERKLDKAKQSYIDKKLKKYYRKPKRQWVKELGTNFAGRAAYGLGEAYDLYNSALANALMQSASGGLSKRQEELYGNPVKAGTTMFAGGRAARGKMANAVAQQVGHFFQDWSDKLSGEFDQQRALRMQMDIRPSGLAMDAYYKLGRYRPERRR